MKVKDLLEQIQKLVREDNSILELDVTLASLEYTAFSVTVTETWDGTENVLDIY